MPSLADTLGSIPGYAGYQASRLRNQQQESADLQQYGQLQNILAGIQKQQQEQQMRQVLADSNGDPEAAMGALIKSGNIAGAHALAPVVKMAAERKQAEEMVAGLRAINAPEQLQEVGAGKPIAVAGEAATPTVDPRLARIEKLNKLSELYARNPVVVQRIQGELDRLQKPEYKTRTYQKGDQSITEELQPDGTWKELGRGPKFSREAASATPGDFTKTGEAFLATLPAADQQMIKKLANYDIDPKTLSTRGGQRERALSLAAQYNPNFDQKNYNAIASAINRFATGPQGNTVRSMNVAIEHMDTARRLGAALQNGDVPVINRIANEFAEQTGKAAPTNFNAVKEIVADEVVKGVIGGAGALQDREAATKKIRDASSPQQMNGVLDSWTELLGGQLKGLEKQYEGATLGRKDFRDRYMTPRARAAVEGKAADTPAASKPIYATNGTTRLMSTDGGMTWKPAQ